MFQKDLLETITLHAEVQVTDEPLAVGLQWQGFFRSCQLSSTMTHDQSTLFEDSPVDVSGLYTAAMLAEMLRVPVEAVRRWHRRGAVLAICRIKKLPYFDFKEATVAKKLAALWHAGSSLQAIEREFDALVAHLPDHERPLADPRLVVVGQRFLWRDGKRLTEPGGQFLIEFDKPILDDFEGEEHIVSLPMTTSGGSNSLVQGTGRFCSEIAGLQQELLQRAEEQQAAGLLFEAAESYRALLLAGAEQAEIHFALAEVLAQLEDFSAARERYFVALEIDQEFIEARLSLGCLYAQEGELELAKAAFEGALDVHRDYADAHFHLANLLERLEENDRVAYHRQEFLRIAPESPWAEAVREQIDA